MGIGTHGKLLREVDDISIIWARCPIADALDQVTAHANKGSLSAVSCSDFVLWHEAANLCTATTWSGIGG